MQDKTINNALLALRKECGEAQVLAERLLAMRGVNYPSYREFDRPLWRGGCRAVVLDVLRQGPCKSGEVADRLQELLPGLNRKRACQRAYMALMRMERRGLVRREGRVWRIT